jgi:hypothetical protein
MNVDPMLNGRVNELILAISGNRDGAVVFAGKGATPITKLGTARLCAIASSRYLHEAR